MTATVEPATDQLEEVVGESAEEPVEGSESAPDDVILETKKSRKTEKKDDTAEALLGLIILSLMIWGIWSWVSDDEELFIDKKPLKEGISKMVANGADLDSIKHYFSSAERIEWGIIHGWSHDKRDYYTGDVSLLHVLKDLQNEYYLNGSAEHGENSAVETLILEYQQRNPFDGLDPTQKDQFDNIRLKLGENYHLVASEVNKLSDELRQKNSLVNQYLADSKTSLYVSVASLAFALLMAVASPFLHRKLTSNKRVN